VEAHDLIGDYLDISSVCIPISLLLTYNTARTMTRNPIASGSKPTRILYWFRTDLRITDSPALVTALALPNIQAFYPVWTFDPTYVYSHLVGLNRWGFLLESMETLSAELTKLNVDQKLLVLRGKPELVLPMVWKEWGITHLVFEKDSNAYARVRDEGILGLARDAGVEVVAVHGHHLYDPEVVVKVNGNKPTMTLNQWQGVGCRILGCS
jgi:cryptochrome